MSIISICYAVYVNFHLIQGVPLLILCPCILCTVDTHRAAELSEQDYPFIESMIHNLVTDEDNADNFKPFYYYRNFLKNQMFKKSKVLIWNIWYTCLKGMIKYVSASHHSFWSWCASRAFTYSRLVKKVIYVLELYLSFWYIQFEEKINI